MFQAAARQVVAAFVSYIIIVKRSQCDAAMFVEITGARNWDLPRYQYKI